ncbi:hypothetical protein [Olivibacter domesticus]
MQSHLSARSNSRTVKKSTYGRRGKKRDTPKRTLSEPANAFLNHQFLPLVPEQQALTNWTHREKTFFESLRYFAGHYHFIPPKPRQQVFPLNVALAFEQAQAALKKANPWMSLFIAEMDDGSCRLITTDNLVISSEVFYIPLRPLYLLHKKNAEQPLANLLLSMMAYFKDILCIPDFESDYMLGTFENLPEWGDYDPASGQGTVEELEEEIRETKDIGGTFLREISGGGHLKKWEERLTAFRPKTARDRTILQTVQSAYQLYREYPQRKWYQNFYPEFSFNEIEDTPIYPEEYISFTWQESGWLASALERYYFSTQQETLNIAEPLYLTVWDRPEALPIDNLDFDTRLFALLENVITILTNEL